jgi:NADPH-dependent 2,4-dienoyl-CoA reductase/sulfur reductase-like enzyme
MRIVIIGATAAGTSAAAKARRLMKNADIIMYEKGIITSFGACGLPFFVGNFFDDVNDMVARTPEEFEKSGIQVKTQHEVIGLDIPSKTITIKNLLSHETITDHYDQLMIATGASPVLPPFIKTLPSNVFMLRSMTDGIALKQAISAPNIKNVAIIGAGFIGLEVAEAALHLGKGVSIIEMRDRIMADSFDSEMTQLMQDHLIQKNIELHLGCRVNSLEGEPVHRIITDQSTVDCDLVVISAGVKPATDFLKNTGIQMTERGLILVDQQGKTNIDGIFAAGDCASIQHLYKKQPTYIPLATVANKLGRIVGENMAGIPSILPPMLGAASLKVLDLEAARVGLSEVEAKQEGYPYSTVVVKDYDHTSYYPPRYELHIKLVYNTETKIILGAQIVGQQGAALRMHALSVAIAKQVTTTELGLLDFGYSPAFTRTWDALNVAGNVAK